MTPRFTLKILHKLVTMSELKITESSSKCKNILYIYSSLNEFIGGLNFKADVLNGKNRCELIVDVPTGYMDAFLLEAIRTAGSPALLSTILEGIG